MFLEMLKEFQNRELELESRVRMKTAFHRKRNYIPLLPTTRSFLMMRTMEVQDRADNRTCLD